MAEGDDDKDLDRLFSFDREGDEGWKAYRRLILAQLKSLDEAVRLLDAKLASFYAKDVAQLRVDIAMLQVKSGVWGAAAGLIVVMISVFVAMVKGWH